MSILHTRLGLAAVAALALTNGCVSAQSGDPPGEPASAALSNRAPQIIYTCSIGGGTVLGSLLLFTDPTAHPTCAVTTPELPNASRVYCQSTPLSCPDCAALRGTLGCFAVP